MDFNILVILLSLIGLITFAYRGFSVIMMAPIMAILAATLTGLDLMPSYTELFMGKAVTYIKSYFPVFMLGAIFGKVMEETGLARGLASAIINGLGKEPTKAVISIVLAGSILTYGGVLLFVVVFAVYPFAAALFKEANYPKRLIPVCIALGAFTATMDALPGTPQIQNVIPTTYFGTNLYAGPLAGFIGSAIIYGLGIFYVTHRLKAAIAKGEGYGKHILNEPEDNNEELPDWRLSCVPLIMVIVINLYVSNPFNWDWAFHWDENSLSTFAPLNLSLIAASVAKVQAIWSINVALILSSIVAAWIGRKKLKRLGGVMHPINAGAIGSTSAVLPVPAYIISRRERLLRPDSPSIRGFTTERPISC